MDFLAFFLFNRTEKKNNLKIKFSGRIFMGHQGPTRRDIPDPSPGTSQTKTLCKAPSSVVLDRQWPACPEIRIGASRDQRISGPQKGPAERGHVKKRQKSTRSVKHIFDTFRHFSRRAKKCKNRQEVSKTYSTLFVDFRTAPVFRPFLGVSERNFVQDNFGLVFRSVFQGIPCFLIVFPFFPKHSWLFFGKNKTSLLHAFPKTARKGRSGKDKEDLAAAFFAHVVWTKSLVAQIARCNRDVRCDSNPGVCLTPLVLTLW